MVRIEKDSIGEIEVPSEVLWGAQTQRSLINFGIGKDLIPIELIHALAKIKQASAIVNNQLGVLDNDKRDLIVNAATDIANGLHDEQFPLRVWQTGSGTQTNMNVNEVISNLASQATKNQLGSYVPLHPNDHVNKSQSTNDIFPAAIHIAVATDIRYKLLPEVDKLIDAFRQKSNEWIKILKIGRTHLQDAVPMTLGQEASAWKDQISMAHKRVENSLKELYQLPLGGTAIGNGINAPKNFDTNVVNEIRGLTDIPFTTSENKFAIMASHDGLVNTMSTLKLLAVSLLKIVNDIRLLASGPRAGLGELILPANEPGSSIMPGKINPTQCEAMAMICTQIIGMDSAVAIAGSSGHLQMNSFKPLIGFNLITTIQLLHDACRSCRTAMVMGIKVNHKQLKKNIDQSLMLVTALSPEIGYEKACEIAKYAYQNDLSLRQAAIEKDYISEAEFEKIVNPLLMANPHGEED